MPEPRATAGDVPVPFSREVTRTTAADQIIEQLRTQILTGARPLGAKLPTERELSVEFGVSSPTIREALRALSSMGLVEARQGSGAYVAPNLSRIIASAMGMITQLENVGLDDLIGLQSVLNYYTAELAVSRATDEDIARLLEQAELTAHCATLDDVTTAVPAFIMAFAADCPSVTQGGRTPTAQSQLLTLHLPWPGKACCGPSANCETATYARPDLAMPAHTTRPDPSSSAQPQA